MRRYRKQAEATKDLKALSFSPLSEAFIRDISNACDTVHTAKSLFFSSPEPREPLIHSRLVCVGNHNKRRLTLITYTTSSEILVSQCFWATLLTITPCTRTSKTYWKQEKPILLLRTEIHGRVSEVFDFQTVQRWFLSLSQYEQEWKRLRIREFAKYRQFSPFSKYRFKTFINCGKNRVIIHILLEKSPHALNRIYINRPC